MSSDPTTDSPAVVNGAVPAAGVAEEQAAEAMAAVSLVPEQQGWSMATRAVHSDDGIAAHRAVAPPMHVSTTFRYDSDPDQLQTWYNVDPSAPLDSHVYSRASAPNTTRLEAVLSSLLGGPTVTYASGLSAFHAMLVHVNPRRIAIGDGYHGCHGVVRLLSRLTGLQQLPLDCDASALRPGDVVHVETPLNPSGEARDLAAYARKARAAGAYLTVDATFAPPPLQDPLALGADLVMHSGTKYFGGHSDMLCGTVTVAPRHGRRWVEELLEQRMYTGSVMGSFEGWLGMRSLRTLELRITRQSATATALVAWLAKQLLLPADSTSTSAAAAVVERVQHASLQEEALVEGSWLRRQMPGGYGPVFAILMKDRDAARRLPSKLRLFHHATSLGGVESLIEWRAMTDKAVDPRLLRVSVGVEGLEDLMNDLAQGFDAIRKEREGGV